MVYQDKEYYQNRAKSIEELYPNPEEQKKEKERECVKIFMDNSKEILNEERKNSFNYFFKRAKIFIKDDKKHSVALQKMININKKDIIIFEVNPEKLKGIDISKSEKIWFPFESMFIEYPILVPMKSDIAISSGFFIRRIDKIIWICLGWNIFSYLEDKSMSLFSNIQIEDVEWNTTRDFTISNPENASGLSNYIYPIVIDIIKKVLKAIKKKEYSSYKKWTSTGLIKKEIVYSTEVSTHMRHFSKDSGKFKIPYFSKEELEEKGYGISEIYVRGNKIQYNIPNRMIGGYVVGKEKEKREENRRVSIFEKKVWKQQKKLGEILSQLFPNEYIKPNDRKILKGLELDFFLRKLRLAFEYDGEQHFDRDLYEKLYGDGFDEQVKRDRKKDKLCKKKNITLIRIKYDEPLTKSHIKNKLKKINYKEVKNKMDYWHGSLNPEFDEELDEVDEE